MQRNAEETSQHRPPLTEENRASTHKILRSGRILPNPSVEATNTLSTSLKIFYEKAREIGDLTLEQCLNLDTELRKTREQRLQAVRKFKKNTEHFKEEINKFKDLSRSLHNSTHRLSSENLDISREIGLEDFHLTWWKHITLENSTMTTTDLNSPHKDMNQSPPAINHKRSIMAANYEKVAKLTAQMVPLFSGHPGPQLISDLQTFIGCCRQVQQCIEDEEKVAFLQIVPTRLRGNAYQLVASSTFSSFEEIERLLYQAYLPRETYHELINKLITCRQYPLENFTSFAARVKQLLIQCKEAAESKYGSSAYIAVKQQIEDFAIAAIKSGVTNPHLSAYLLTLNENVLDMLINKALDMEKLQQGLPHLQYNFPYLTTGNITATGIEGNTYPTQYTGNFPNCLPLGSQLTQNSTAHTPNVIPVTGHTTTQASIPIPAPQMFPSTSSHTSLIPLNNSHTSANQFTTHPTQAFDRLPPTSTSLTDTFVPTIHSNRVPHSYNGQRKSALAKISCTYCNLKGHTYDDCLKRKNTPYCLKCKISGHDAKNCRKINTHPPDNPDTNRFQHTTRGSPRVYHVQLRCDFCGRRGHSVSECMQKERWESRNSGNGHQSTENSPVRL